MYSFHYRPVPRGYFSKPFVPIRVKAKNVVAKIEGGSYKVIVFLTDINSKIHAPVVSRTEGEEAARLAVRMLNDWADLEGKIEKCAAYTKKENLDQSFREYTFLYCQPNSDRHELIALVKNGE